MRPHATLQRVRHALLIAAWLMPGLSPIVGAEPLQQSADGMVSIELENREPAYPFTSVVVFGDSMSDNGNMLTLTGGTLPADPPYYRGRYSNGLVWPEYLAADLSLPLDDYAHGSALSGYGNLEGDYPGLLTQVDGYVAANETGADPNALYVVWAGANDFLEQMPLTFATAGSITSTAVANISTAVAQLAGLGARHIWVGAMPDLGRIPWANGPDAPASSAELSSISRDFNTNLRSALANTGISTKLFDVYQVQNHLAAQPALHGLVNVDESCVRPQGGDCATPDTHLFWDDRHLTTAGHRVLADQLMGLIHAGASDTHAWTVSRPQTASGQAVEASPDLGQSVAIENVSQSPRLDFQVEFRRSGTHYLWLRGIGTSSGSDSVHVGLNGQMQATSADITGFAVAWTWSNQTVGGSPAQLTVPEPGIHTVSVWMSEDGVVLDKLVLSTNAGENPVGFGPQESPRGIAGGPPTNQFEAEQANFSGAFEVASNYGGYTGSGFVDYVREGFVEWNVNAPEDGTYQLVFRYALGSGNRPLRIAVDGATVDGSLDFRATGGWSTWAEVSISVPLSAGSHTVRAASTGRSGANVDHLRLELDGTPPPPPPPSESISYEAEQASFSGTFGVASNNGGYTGSGFVDYVREGFVEWNVNAPEDGTYQLVFRYALGSGNRPLRIAVDGATVDGSLDFRATGGWSTWAEVSIGVTLGAGSHTVRAASTGQSGANVDHLRLELDGTPPRPPSESISYEAEQASFSSTFGVANNNAGYTGSGFVDYVGEGFVDWNINAPEDGTYRLVFRYALGSGNRPLRISVDGATLDDALDFRATGGWSTWAEVSIGVTLSAGSHTVRAASTGQSGANLDNLEISL